jgi:hypothetical protein
MASGGARRTRLIGVLGASLLVVLLASGCTSVVAGTARPAAGLKPRPLAGQTVAQVLLDDATLSKLLGQPLVTDPDFPPRFGGFEQLQDDEPAVPADCLGAAVMLEKGVYRATDVRDVAVESWMHGTWLVKVMSVKEGVVSFRTAADAAGLFAKLRQQWQKCNGTTLVWPRSAIKLRAAITDVRDADSVVAASVSRELTLPGAPSAAIVQGRAVGTRGNCIVEVAVDLFPPSNPAVQGTGDIGTSAVDIARVMMDRISAAG